MDNDLQEKYCSFEVSQLLKEKGFGVPVQTCYDKSDCIKSNNVEFVDLSTAL